MIKKLLFLCCLLSLNPSFSQQHIVSDKTIISILTVGTADESHSLYGHTALRIKDEDADMDLVYNYGMFDFATENFVLKFIKGDLQYYAAAYPYEDFEYSYKMDNRSIYEQVLNLSVSEKKALVNKLDTSLLPENRLYTYKFIDRNCTTKVIDVVNEVLIGKPIVKKDIDPKISYRDVLYPYVENQFYQKLGINIIFGEKVDHTATKLFLPFDLFENLKKTTYNNKPLVVETNTIFEANRTPSFSWMDSIYSLIGVLVLLVFLNKKASTTGYFLVLGGIGVLFSGIGLYSLHREVLWNYNALLFNPMYVSLVFFMLKNNTKWMVKTSWFCLITLGVYTLYVIPKVHFLIVLPILITTAILLIRLIKKPN